MCDVVAQIFRDAVHYLEHSRDDLLQEICLFADNFMCNLVRKKQDAMQPIGKDRRHLVILMLFLQELNSQALRLLLIRW